MTDPVERYYDSKPESEWARLEKHRTEFAVTLHALADYLPEPPARILDVGSGPGRYAIELVQFGYEVTLLDLSQANLSFAQQKASESGVKFQGLHHGNALDLSDFGNHLYDAVLLMGPLYHLIHVADRIRAVQEAVRVLVPGGLLFAAFINRFGVFRNAAYMSAKNPANDWVSGDPAFAFQILQSGWQDDIEGAGFTRAYFVHPDEIAPLMESAGLSTLAIVNSEGVVGDNEDYVNNLTGEAWNTWVQFNYLIGMDPAARGMAGHLLYIGRKI